MTLWTALAVVLTTAAGAACVLIGAIVYLLPAIIAYDRHHPQKQAIFALNLLFGWTFLGWAGAMIWAWVNLRPAPAEAAG